MYRNKTHSPFFPQPGFLEIYLWLTEGFSSQKQLKYMYYFEGQITDSVCDFEMPDMT